MVIGLLVGASFVDHDARATLWMLAILLDWGAPALFGVAEWRLVPAHFAERHNLVIILALGESIVALGAASVDLTSVIFAAVLGMGLASALWWIYFDVVALVTERRLIRATEGRGGRAGARLLLIPALPDGGRHRPRCSRARSDTGARRSAARRCARSLLGGTAIYLLAMSPCASATRTRSTSSGSLSPSC